MAMLASVRQKCQLEFQDSLHAYLYRIMVGSDPFPLCTYIHIHTLTRTHARTPHPSTHPRTANGSVIERVFQSKIVKE